MRPTFAQLEAFYWIGRLGSFHAAAKHLNLTQPAISARISELEDALEIQLFDRIRQRAVLTDRGQEILISVDRLLKIGDEIAGHKDQANLLRGLLRLGAVESVALFALPILLPQLRAKYPGLKIELTLDIGSVLNRKLHAREIDLAILNDAQTSDLITIKQVGSIEWAWVASSKFQLPSRLFKPSDLRDVPILCTPHPSTIHGVMMDWFRTASVEPRNITLCNSLALMSRLVIAGTGVAVLQPQILLSEIESEQIRIIPCKPAMQPRTMAVAYYASSQSYKPLVDLIIEALHKSNLLTSTSRAR